MWLKGTKRWSLVLCSLFPIPPSSPNTRMRIFINMESSPVGNKWHIHYSRSWMVILQIDMPKKENLIGRLSPEGVILIPTCAMQQAYNHNQIASHPFPTAPARRRALCHAYKVCVSALNTTLLIINYKKHISWKKGRNTTYRWLSREALSAWAVDYSVWVGLVGFFGFMIFLFTLLIDLRTWSGS